MNDPDFSPSALTDRLARVIPWVARAAWILVAIVGGSALEGAVDERSSSLRWVVAVGGWTVFAAVAVALLIPSVLSLTISRVGAPLALVAGGVSAGGGAEASAVAALAFPALVAVAAVFTAEFGRWMVQASAYGDEDRLPLRSPAAVGAAAALMWTLWAGAAIFGPVLCGAGNLVVGVPLVLLAVAMAALIGPRWHKMSKRWLVLVPAGLVVHDPVVLADTLMVRSNQLLSISLAQVDTEAADLTGPASGHALQIDTSETVSTVFAFTPSEPNGRAIHMTGFLVAPSRPGAALARSAERGLPLR